MERIRIQKQQIDFDIAKKKAVVEVIEEYTRGIDSEALLNQALKRDIVADKILKEFPNATKADVRHNLVESLQNRETYNNIIK
jgi:hypothetical protein